MKVPPENDFVSYAKLITKQEDHFAVLNGYADKVCANDQGLDGILEDLRAPVHEIFLLFKKELERCTLGMDDVAGRAKETCIDYQRADQQSAAELKKLYPRVSWMPDIGAIPHIPAGGDYSDTDIDPAEPTSAEEDTGDNVQEQLDGIEHHLTKGLLKGAEDIYKFFTGNSLLEQILHPLLGTYGRLKYLQDGYSELSDNIYLVSWTLRRGSLSLATEWAGDTAKAFDVYMFRWSMGTGGIGDAAKLISDLYGKAYETITEKLKLALDRLGKLCDKEITKLVKIAANDVKIVEDGGGFEDLFSDAFAACYTAFKSPEIAQALLNLAEGIVDTVRLINDIRPVIKSALSKYDEIERLVNSSAPTPHSARVQAQQKFIETERNAIEFEKSDSWKPEDGVARILLIPSGTEEQRTEVPRYDPKQNHGAN